jgi:UDP-glucose 4-epimerase
MKKIMVTGGAGFVGSHLIERLLAEGNEIYCFDFAPLETSNNLKGVKNHPNLHYFQGDIRSPEDIRKFWVDGAVCIYHLASVVGIKNYIADPLKLVDIVVIGTRHLLEEAARTNTKVIFSSTSEIFAKNPAVPWGEDDDRVLGPTRVDRWSYSSSKAVCEHMLYGMGKAKDLPFTIARFFNVYGARQNPYFVVSQTVYKILRGEKPLMYDGGAMTRCFTYVGDIIDGLILLADNDKALGEAFNLGNPVENSVREVIETALCVTGSDIGYEDVDTGKLYGKSYEDIIRRVPKVSKAKEVLGWQAKIQLEEGLRRTIEWAKANPWYLT